MGHWDDGVVGGGRGSGHTWPKSHWWGGWNSRRFQGRFGQEQLSAACGGFLGSGSFQMEGSLGNSRPWLYARGTAQERGVCVGGVWPAAYQGLKLPFIKKVSAEPGEPEGEGRFPDKTQIWEENRNAFSLSPGRPRPDCGHQMCTWPQRRKGERLGGQAESWEIKGDQVLGCSYFFDHFRPFIFCFLHTICPSLLPYKCDIKIAYDVGILLLFYFVLLMFYSGLFHQDTYMILWFYFPVLFCSSLQLIYDDL